MNHECLPGCHSYRPHGSLLYCERCGAVAALRPILERQSPLPAHSVANAELPESETDGDLQPTVAELDAHIAHIRHLAGLAAEEDDTHVDLIERTNNADAPKVPVDREFLNLDPPSTRLPATGL